MGIFKECRKLQEEQVASFFQAYFGPIGRLEISPEIVVIRVKSQSLFMALEGLFSLFKKCKW